MRNNESNTMFIDFSHVILYNDLQKAISDEYLRFEPYLKNACKRFVMELKPTVISDDSPYKDINIAFFNIPIVKRTDNGEVCVSIRLNGNNEMFEVNVLVESLGSLTGLRELNLSTIGLINLPTNCFSSLFGLVLLSLEGCERLVSLPRLPPRLIRFEASGCYSMNRSLDDLLLNLLTSLDHECRGQTEYVISVEEIPHKQYYYWLLEELEDVKPEDFQNFFAIMPSGGKIPSWFDPNIKYYDEGRYECETEMEVPLNFRDSK
ncbi:hypothetical protein K1719_038477 [Acacia pycnantha]|nr:hypothetical protein K1719_038477 [Acacia pycnantha]